MLPRAALTAIQARARPTLGLVQPAALPAPALALLAARRVSGRAWSASFAAWTAIFLARHCMSVVGMIGVLCIVAGTMSSPVINPHEELPSSARVNLA